MSLPSIWTAMTRQLRTQVVGGVGVPTGGEVSTLHRNRSVDLEVVTCTFVAVRGLDYACPVVTAEQHRVARLTVVRRSGQRALVAETMTQHSLHHIGADVGE